MSNVSNVSSVSDAGYAVNVLEVSKLCKKYDAFALNDVTFDVPRGYITGFIGPNGAGKTTTIKLILDVIKADSGEINLFGSVSNVAQNGEIGVVFDAPLYCDDWTVKNTEAALAPFYKKWDKKMFAGHLKRFGLDPKKKIKELSRGMKVKLQIAAALSHDARFLLLDEPTSGLDPVARDEICDLLREFVSNENNSVLFSTHITSDLEKTADFITFILNGNIAFTGTKDGLMEKYARVTGGLKDLNGEQRKLIIGYREHGTGFEGMAETRSIGKLPDEVLIEELSLDEIIIFMNTAKGGCYT